MLSDLCDFLRKRQEAGLTKEDVHGGIMLEIWEINAQKPPHRCKTVSADSPARNLSNCWASMKKNLCAHYKGIAEFCIYQMSARATAGCARKGGLNSDLLIVKCSAVNHLWIMTRSFMRATWNGQSAFKCGGAIEFFLTNDHLHVSLLWWVTTIMY